MFLTIYRFIVDWIEFDKQLEEDILMIERDNEKFNTKYKEVINKFFGKIVIK